MPHRYKFWLQQNNFYKFYPSEGSTYTFIKRDQNILEETNEKRVKDFVLDYLLKRDDVGFQPYDYMANNTKFFSADYLTLLETAEIEVKEDTPNECFIYFRNCVVKVTKEGIEKIWYDNKTLCKIL